LTRPPYVDAVFALTDPWPSLVQAGKVFSGFARRVLGRR
jgi:hypothetical protein